MSAASVLRRRIIAIHRDERGSTLLLSSLFLLMLVTLAGLVADGGTVLVQRRDLQGIADAAAAAGAMQVDEAAYRAADGAAVTLDPWAAEEAAIAFLVGEDGTDYAVHADEARVEVTVARQAETVFLRIVGVTHVEITAYSVAEPRVETGGPVP